MIEGEKNEVIISQAVKIVELEGANQYWIKKAQRQAEEIEKLKTEIAKQDLELDEQGELILALQNKITDLECTISDLKGEGRYDFDQRDFI